jgi:hypothetical protein
MECGKLYKLNANRNNEKPEPKVQTEKGKTKEKDLKNILAEFEHPHEAIESVLFFKKYGCSKIG